MSPLTCCWRPAPWSLQWQSAAAGARKLLLLSGSSRAVVSPRLDSGNIHLRLCPVLVIDCPSQRHVPLPPACYCSPLLESRTSHFSPRARHPNLSLGLRTAWVARGSPELDRMAGPRHRAPTQSAGPRYRKRWARERRAPDTKSAARHKERWGQHVIVAASSFFRFSQPMPG